MVRDRRWNWNDWFAMPAVTLGETIATCRDILAGGHDDLAVDAFHFAGSIDEIRERSASK
jgi:F0F1-type ATP synthase beta subunit